MKQKITKAVFGSGRPSLRAMGLTSMSLMLACAENSFRYLRLEKI
jgi:hypothetical protein